jgi:hypothetical protein
MRSFVGQPILAVAGFQPALFASRGSRQGSSVDAQGWACFSLPTGRKAGIFRPLRSPSCLSISQRKCAPTPLSARIPRQIFRVHMSDRRSLPGASLAIRNLRIAIRKEPAESRLQPGLAAPQSARGFPGCPGAVHVSRRQAGGLSHIASSLKSRLAKTSCDEFPESVNAARRSACATSGVS